METILSFAERLEVTQTCADVAGEQWTQIARLPVVRGPAGGGPIAAF